MQATFSPQVTRKRDVLTLGLAISRPVLALPLPPLLRINPARTAVERWENEGGALSKELEGRSDP